MQPYIEGAYDVASDGNCGYRAVASAMGFGPKSWRKVREDLINELRSMRELYEIIFGGSAEVEKTQQTLQHLILGLLKNTGCIFRRWDI